MSNLRDALVAEYLFDGNAVDTSGNGNHGQVIGAKPAADRFGNPGRALRFDGKDDYVVVVDPPKMSAETLTVSAWVRFDDDGFDEVHGDWCNAVIGQDNGKIYWKEGEPDQRRIFRIACRGRRVMSHRLKWWGDGLRATYPVLGETWYHLAIVVDHKTHYLYIDGVLHESKEDWFASHPSEPLYIGRMAPPDRQQFFKGVIDDVRIYNRAFSATEIDALYRANGWSEPPHLRHVGRPEPLEWQGDEWTSLDIDTYVLGRTEASGDQLLIETDSANIHQKTDSFRYVYRRVRGDFSATVFLQSAPDTGAWAKAGIMVRSGLEPTSAYAMVGGLHRIPPRLSWRAESGGGTIGVGDRTERDFEPIHLKLVRTGKRVECFSSPDGERWSGFEQAPEVELGDGDVYVGLAACTLTFGKKGQAIFDGWRLEMHPRKGDRHV